MAANTLLCRIAKSGTRSSSFLHATRGYFTSHSTIINTKTLQTIFHFFKVPSFLQGTSYANSASIFDAGNQTKYYIFGGKGGAGKTNCAASLAVKFADHGHPTVPVSTDYTHPLSNSFDQDLTDAKLIRGLESPFIAIVHNPEKLKAKFGGTAGDYLNTLGLGKLAEHWGESACEKLFDSSNPGLDEAFIISKVMQLAESPMGSKYTRVVFDTSCSKGDDLPNHYMSDSLIRDVTTVLDYDTDMLRELIEDLKRARELIRDSTEYIITTTPTDMGVLESSRLHASLKKEKVLVRRLIVTEILPPSSTDCKFSSMKREDEMRALEMIKKDPELGNLDLIKAPLVDGEIRGIAALKSMGDVVWK